MARVQTFDTSAVSATNPHAYEERVEVEVDVRPEHMVIAGNMVPKGTHKLMVPRSMVEHLNGLVEDEDKIRTAEDAYARKYEAFMANGGQDYRCSLSPSGEFQALYLRGIRPLRSVKVISEGHAPPLTAEERKVAAFVQNASERSTRRGKKTPAA